MYRQNGPPVDRELQEPSGRHMMIKTIIPTENNGISNLTCKQHETGPFLEENLVTDRPATAVERTQLTLITYQDAI
jgi:hypothetical protein